MTDLYPPDVRPYVIASTILAVLLLLLDWIVFFAFCSRAIMPFGFLNLIYIAVLWSRWSNKVIHLNAYMVYVLINIALLSVSLARVLEADYVNCPSPAGAIGLFVVQLLVCLLALGIAAYLRLHVLHTSALAGAERITYAETHPVLQPHPHGSHDASRVDYGAAGKAAEAGAN